MKEQVEKFLFHEADCMDEGLYDEWLSLWDESGIYWVPCNQDDLDPSRQVSIIYDDYARLSDRIERLNSPNMHTQLPKSRMRRVVGNVVVNENGDDEIEVKSNFILAELRHREQDNFAGRSVHKLKTSGDSFKILHKKVLLIQNDDPIGVLTFLI
jgi:3-phenylpropionate/cinnamic acid dioxygenase small subunit